MARKKLSDAAKQFIQSGEIDTPVEIIREKTSNEEVTEEEKEIETGNDDELEKPSISSTLGKNLKQELFGSVSSKESNIRFTVDLPSSLHRRLNQLSLDAGKPKTELVRIMIRQALDSLDY